jgi:hypothetical protein
LAAVANTALRLVRSKLGIASVIMIAAMLTTTINSIAENPRTHLKVLFAPFSIAFISGLTIGQYLSPPQSHP